VTKTVIFSQFTEADKSNHRMIIKGTLRNCSYAIRGHETNEAGCLHILLRTNILNIVCQNQTSLSTDCPNKNLSNPAVRQVIMSVNIQKRSCGLIRRYIYQSKIYVKLPVYSEHRMRNILYR